MRTRKYKNKHNKTKKIRGGVIGKKGEPIEPYEFEMLKIQKLIDNYGEKDQENLQELQDKINGAIINYIMKSSSEKREIIDKIDAAYNRIFVKREN